jgi:hypothetical protein
MRKTFLSLIFSFGTTLCASAQTMPDMWLPSAQTINLVQAPPLAPAVLSDPEIDGLDFPNNGVTSAVSGASTTITAAPGSYNGSVITRSYNWHTVNAPTTSLGTSTTLTINTSTTPALVGQAIQVDETVAGLAGNLTRTSHWFGPISATAPVSPPTYETETTPTLVLPTEPSNFLEGFGPTGPGGGQHAVFPGCLIPPLAPTNTATTGSQAHVWYFDPVNGLTQTQQTANGVPTASQGHLGHPFKDITALLNSVTGYSGVLFGFDALIVPGDTVYLEPGWGPTTSVGNISSGATPAAYSTSDGTTTGTITFTWIMGDPAATSTPVLNEILIGNGNGGGAGLIFKNLNVEQFRGGSLVSVTGSASKPTHDIYLESINASSWIGHSADPWFPSHIPTTGGSSDGTIVTAAPAMSNQFSENLVSLTVSSAANASTFNLTSDIRTFMSLYVWSPGLYIASNTPVAPSTGIPNGSKVVAINGVTAANFVNTGVTVNAILASSLTALPQGATFTSTADLPTTNDGDYHLVAANATVVQTVFVWNGTVFASIGTIVPQTGSTNEVIYASTVDHNAQWNGTTWVDLGTPTLTLGPCDPVNDAQTGCPSKDFPGLAHSATSNVPGCDPAGALSGVGGCPASGPVPWNGTTRALSNEAIIFTDFLVVVPKGGWNSSDWNDNSSAQFVLHGGIGSPVDDQLAGATCLSIKDSTARDTNNSYSVTDLSDTVIYNDKSKWTAGDAFDIYSDNRTWVIHSVATDPTLLWAHQDAIQIAMDSGAETDQWYNNAMIENELFQYTDPTNLFPREWQGINVTDDVDNTMYVCCNTIVATTNGIGTAGQFNVVVSNDMMGSSVQVGNQTKNGTATPISTLLANNIGNGIGRYIIRGSNVPANPCTIPVSGANGDGVTQETNLSVPVPPATLFSNITCAIGSTASYGTSNAFGSYVGLNAWSATDFRSEVSGVSPLFIGYSPLSPPAFPNPGFGQSEFSQFATCYQGSIAPIQQCPATAGSLNFRPNSSFSGSTFSLPLSVSRANLLPSGEPNGTLVIVSNISTIFAACTPPTVPAGSAPGATCPTTIQAGVTSDYSLVGTTFNPGILGAGTNLGAQMPIADHDGKPWNSTPAIGAYEGVAAAPSSVPFTALNTFFMAPTTATPAGNDSNAGTLAAPWATPNHAVHCGDVIIAVPGSYNGDMSQFGAVSNCPSTTGGIPGTAGGVQAAVLLCGGADLGSSGCLINCATAECNNDPNGGVQAGINLNQSNWSIQGWQINGNAINSYSGLQFSGCQSSTTIHTHGSAINNVVWNGGQGFTPQDCQIDPGSTPGNGYDYISITGNIFQNSAQNTICLAAVDPGFVAKGSSTLDTHSWIYGNFTFNNLVTACDTISDGEDYMFDTLDLHGTVGKYIFANNVGYFAERYCMTATFSDETASSSSLTIKMYNNTCYDNMQRDTAFAGGAGGEIFLSGPTPWTYQVYNNIDYQPHATNGEAGSDVLTGMLNGNAPSGSGSVAIGAAVRTGAQNVTFGDGQSCLGVCNTNTPPISAVSTVNSNFGTDFYENPTLKNPTDLIANHIGVPNCTGFVTTTACMGWNANTNSMTSLSVLDDLTPSSAHSAGRGFQLASTTCDSSTTDDLATDYPTWLHGIVYLHWNGASITENSDLVTKPCGQ